MEKEPVVRHSRWGAPPPPDGLFIPQPSDILVHDALEYYHRLPTSYLYALSKRGSYQNTQRRLNILWRNRFIFRPKRQREGTDPKSHCIVYQNTEKGSKGATGVRFKPCVSNSFPHDLMTSCFVASVELGTWKDDNTFLWRPGKLTSDVKSDLIPDDVFGIAYPDRAERWFAVEVDRNTESTYRIARKMAEYNDVLRTKRFHTRWGIPNLNILILTTNPTHMTNLKKLVPDFVDPKYHTRYKFACEPLFGTRGDSDEESFWEVPKKLMTHLYEGPWLTTAGVAYIDRV